MHWMFAQNLGAKRLWAKRAWSLVSSAEIRGTKCQKKKKQPVSNNVNYKCFQTVTVWWESTSPPPLESSSLLYFHQKRWCKCIILRFQCLFSIFRSLPLSCFMWKADWARSIKKKKRVSAHPVTRGTHSHATKMSPNSSRRVSRSSLMFSTRLPLRGPCSAERPRCRRTWVGRLFFVLAEVISFTSGFRKEAFCSSSDLDFLFLPPPCPCPCLNVHPSLSGDAWLWRTGRITGASVHSHPLSFSFFRICIQKCTAFCLLVSRIKPCKKKAKQTCLWVLWILYVCK